MTNTLVKGHTPEWVWLFYNLWSGTNRGRGLVGYSGTSHSWAGQSLDPITPTCQLSVAQTHPATGYYGLRTGNREHRHHHRHRQRITIIHINVNVYDRRRGLAGYPFGTVLTLRAYAFGRLRVRSYAKCALLWYVHSEKLSYDTVHWTGWVKMGHIKCMIDGPRQICQILGSNAFSVINILN